MFAWEAYLLRTERQKADFLARFSLIVGQNAATLEAWFGRLPLYEWVQFKPPVGKEEIVIGILCLLYLDGRINMSFSRDLRFIRREAASVEEYEAWAVCPRLKT